MLESSFPLLLIAILCCKVDLLQTMDLPDDVSEVTWAHAVNSQAKLHQALKSSITFLEADISMGYIRRLDNVSPTLEPIMAHPPAATSDISLKEWISTVLDRGNGSKGVKLDFKSTNALDASLRILNQFRNNISFPIWLNADILSGPGNSRNKPVDAQMFIQECRRYFPNATLSIGWTTNAIAPEEEYRYTWNDVWTMATTIRCAEIDGLQPITFPIRAVFVKDSVAQIQWLVNVIQDSSVTVWSHAFDDLQVDTLLELRRALPISKVYYDLPDNQDEKFQKMKRNATYDPSTNPSNHWGVLRDTTEPFGCQDETLVAGNTVIYGGDRTVAVFNEEPIPPSMNVSGNLFPYALSDFDGFFSEREGALAVVMADNKDFWSSGHWSTWQNVTSLAVGVNSPNHSESCCSVHFDVRTIFPEGATVSDVRLHPCTSSEPCLVYTDSSEANVSSAKEFYVGFIFMGNRAMVLDDININGLSDYFVKPVTSVASRATFPNMLLLLIKMFVGLLLRTFIK